MNETRLQERYFRKLDIKLVDGEYESMINHSLPRPKDVYKTFSPLRDKGREEMIAVYLTADLYVVAYDVISTGNKDTAMLYMDELLEGVILTRARFFIVLHNHPTGHAIPSKQDLELMMRLKEYMEPLKRVMLDFLVIGHPKQKLPDGKAYWSMFEANKGTRYGKEIELLNNLSKRKHSQH